MLRSFWTHCQSLRAMMMSSKISLKPFSKKQLDSMLWWTKPQLKDHCGIICDGAVRSGKTFSMSLGFVFWSMKCFDKGSFAICGKTIKSVRRNVIKPLFDFLESLDFLTVKDYVSKGYFEVTMDKKTNRYYLFGGKDESSGNLIQGVTLCGILLDEVAIMPRSFVEQAIARCSVEGSRLWFNCNPENPFHWFKKEWIDKAVQKNCHYIHFDLSDNPSLSQKIIKRYHALYSGSFYERYVLGKWVSAEGLVYPFFSPEKHVCKELPSSFSKFVMSVDYGTVNPTSCGLWGKSGEVWYRIAEYYYSSKVEGKLRTDEEHYEGIVQLSKFAEKYGGSVSAIVCDPSAASFMEVIRRHGQFKVLPAKNDVLSGIRKVSDAINQGKVKFSEECSDTIREFSLYRWDERLARDAPIKENDHSMDDVRYFVTTFLNNGADDFFVLSVSRG